MNFFFVYDTTFCKSDDEDSEDAVVIYYPVQCAEEARSLCCQLAGVARFMQSNFSSPSVVGLERGKFAFHWDNKYLVGLGAEGAVPTNVLKERLAFLCGIFRFYHGSMDRLLVEWQESRSKLLLKLELCWSRYMALAECTAPAVIALPLRKGSLVSSANQLLHACQMNALATAGAIFCNGRVLSTQFPPYLTNFLSLLSNSNASAPVEEAPCVESLPPGVELKRIFLSHESLSAIHKLNHTRVGSHFRLKSTHSGSEGDSEGAHAKGPDRYGASSEDPSALKRWSSELCLSPTPHTTGRRRTRSHHKPKLGATPPGTKVQVLRCRSHSWRHNSASLESSDLRPSTLYVQRCGAGTLLLLLNAWDKEALEKLWNCGFTFLRELECSEKSEIESPYNIEPSFYILLYNNLERVLKDYPPCASVLQRQSRETLQRLKEHLDYKTLCLLSSSFSLFASHSPHQVAFYVQPEPSSRRLEPLLSLGHRAQRRLLKYFRVEV